MMWLGGVILAALIGLFLYWQLIITEGVYLGQNVVTLLYDWTAHKYEGIKEFDPQDERNFLAAPLYRALGYNFSGIVLDVAAGTGRLPRALAQISRFRGQVIGVDHSVKMLAVARQLIPDLVLVVADAMRLPFAQNSVGGVTCLESLEFFPQPVAGIAEQARVLAPGGVLLTTRRIGWEAKLMPGKTWPSEELQAILEALPLTSVTIIPWQNLYDQVWAIKQD